MTAEIRKLGFGEGCMVRFGGRRLKMVKMEVSAKERKATDGGEKISVVNSRGSRRRGHV